MCRQDGEALVEHSPLPCAILPSAQVRKLRLMLKKTPDQDLRGTDSGPVFNIHSFVCSLIHSLNVY